jgi:acyl-CoA thioesterase FadM
MYPWLRLLKTGAALVRAPRIGLLDTTCIRLRVWPNDLDFNLHVNNGRYLMLADLGRVDWFIRSGVLQLARQQRALPVVGDAIAKFRRELTLGQRFEVRTRLLGWDHRWGFLEHRFYRDNRALGVVAIRGVFRGPDGPLDPGSFLAGLGLQMASPELPDWIREWNSGGESLSQMLRKEEQQLGLR